MILLLKIKFVKYASKDFFAFLKWVFLVINKLVNQSFNNNKYYFYKKKTIIDVCTFNGVNPRS